MSRKAKIFLGFFVFLLLLVFVIVPVVIGMFAKDKVIAEIQKAVGAPVKASSVSVNLLPPGAKISGLEIGSPDAAANNQPIAKIDSVSVGVTYGTVFGSEMNVTSCSISGLAANISVDANGASSLAKLIDGMPLSTRTTNLPIGSLVVKKLRADVYLSAQHAIKAGTPDSTLEISYASVSDLVLSAPGKPLGKEFWSRVNIEGIKLTAPSIGDNKGEFDGVEVGDISAEFAQSPTDGQPIKVKTVAISKLRMVQIYTGPGAEPAVRRASRILPLGLQPTTKKGKDDGGIPELLVDKLTMNGSVETRGLDANGAVAYWRLNALQADGSNLAFGPGVAAASSGQFTMKSSSESSSGPGDFDLALNDITGSYPNWTFNATYKLNGVAATAFSIPAQDASGSGIKSGTVSMEFAGPAQNGRLQIDGSITLSQDLEVTGSVNNQVAKIVRGQPIKTVRIRGTIEKPDVQMPDAFAGLVQKMFASILAGGPMGVLDTAGGFMGTSVEQGVREATKGVDKGKELIKKVPGIKGIFGQ